MMDPQTARKAILSQDLNASAVSPGACSCGAATFYKCHCTWGDLIAQMIKVGYELPAAEAAMALPALQAEATQVMAGARKALMQSLASAWKGSEQSFRTAFNIAWTTWNRLGIVLKG